MKLAIVGIRNFHDYEFLATQISQILNIELIITSDVNGVDKLALKYAHECGIRTEIKTANWKEYGQHAAVYRNSDIISNSDYVLVIDDNKSPNAKQCIELAKGMNKEMKIVNYSK